MKKRSRKKKNHVKKHQKNRSKSKNTPHKVKKNRRKVDKKRGKRVPKKVDKKKNKVQKKDKIKKIEVTPPPQKKVEQIIPATLDEKRVPNVYFTSETEEAINQYNLFTDVRDKDRIYNEKIKYAFEKIAENIYNTFKFSYSDVSPVEVQKQAISHMVANIDKYDSSKGRAFGYFSIIAKNWFILDNNSNYRRFTKHVEICDHPGDSGEFVVEPEHQKRESEMKEFIRLMVDFWDVNVDKYFTKKRDRDIAAAVVELFRNSERIDVFNKKALYLYIRDIADCQTQHITKVINRMKFAQRNITEEYFSKGVVTGTHISINL